MADNVAPEKQSAELSSGGSVIGVYDTPVISYFCPIQNKSCLEGLSQNEKISFMRIVQKQFNKGIRVVINYSELAL